MVRSSTTVSPSTTPPGPVGREAAPEQQRQHQPEGPGDHEDDADRVDAEPGGDDVHGEGQDGTDDQEKDADPEAHAPDLLDLVQAFSHGSRQHPPD
jgi:hypothetical protein